MIPLLGLGSYPAFFLRAGRGRGSTNGETKRGAKPLKTGAP
jgi:hypothetical protein